MGDICADIVSQGAKQTCQGDRVNVPGQLSWVEPETLDMETSHSSHMCYQRVTRGVRLK